jgi:hypothetical protein
MENNVPHVHDPISNHLISQYRLFEVSQKEHSKASSSMLLPREVGILDEGKDGSKILASSYKLN